MDKGEMRKKEKREPIEKPPWRPRAWFGKIWQFIWYDESIWSWIVNVLLAYVLIKFIFYPLIGVVLHTGFPIVAVVSTSMVHNDTFDSWWAANEDYYLSVNITKDQFQEFPFKNGFNKGDLMVLYGKSPADIEIGEIIVFQSRKSYPIIHRVIKKSDMGMWVFETKGDNNKAQIRDPELDETRVLEKAIHGKAVLRIPWLGYVKIWFVDLLHLVGINLG